MEWNEKLAASPTGSVVERTTITWSGSVSGRFEIGLPVRLHFSSGILPRFGTLAEIAEHRIDEALQLGVAFTNGLLHSLPLPFGA